MTWKNTDDDISMNKYYKTILYYNTIFIKNCIYVYVYTYIGKKFCKESQQTLNKGFICTVKFMTVLTFQSFY